VFTGGDGPPPQTVRRLLEGKDALLAAADSGLVAAEEAGFRPGWVIGDMDSLDDDSRLSGYPPQCVMRYGTDKDYTDTELALSLITEKGCDEIWIIGSGGGRIDHLFGIRSLFEREVFPGRWVTGAEDIRCVEAASAESEFSLRLEAGALV
jgi:thiamine pyrophosphokinase